MVNYVGWMGVNVAPTARPAMKHGTHRPPGAEPPGSEKKPLRAVGHESSEPFWGIFVALVFPSYLPLNGGQRII